MDDNRYFTLTSPAGRFFFPKGTIMSHAKLIRDSITASFRGKSNNTTRIDATRPEMARRWFHDNIGGPVASADIPFEWSPIGVWSN